MSTVPYVYRAVQLTCPSTQTFPSPHICACCVPSMSEAERGMKSRDWRLMGEIDARSRPKNSLAAGMPVEYERTRCTGTLSDKDNREIQRLLKERIHEGRFDNFEYDICNKEEASAEYTAEDATAAQDQEVKREDIEGLFQEIKWELDALTSACGAWHSADTRMYAEKRTVPEKKAAVHTGGRDAKSMRVLRKAKNVRILK
eukprot:jgi/Antlo1/2235/2157